VAISYKKTSAYAAARRSSAPFFGGICPPQKDKCRYRAPLLQNDPAQTRNISEKIPAFFILKPQFVELFNEFLNFALLLA
jgi:hypothetical protein